VATPLVASTVKAARWVASGKAVPAGTVSARAAALTEGVCRAMFMTRVRITTAALLLAACAGAGAALIPRPAPAQAPKDAEQPRATASRERAKATQTAPGPYLESRVWALTKVDVEKRTVGLQLLRHLGEDSYGDLSALEPDRRPLGAFTLEDFTVAKGAKVFVDGREGGLGGLKKRMRVTLRLAPGGAAVTRIEATSAQEDVVLKAADVAKNTITVTAGRDEVTLPLTVDAKISIVGIRREAPFTDLKPGMRLDLVLGSDEGKVVVKRIKAGEAR
jgi:hypothetical protein